MTYFPYRFRLNSCTSLNNTKYQTTVLRKFKTRALYKRQSLKKEQESFVNYQQLINETILPWQ